ncbi:unnamed protein product [Rotaria magnacalcarata]|uniref:RNA helicase n=1 Tax=Rotaria magnacalcarata TaxID=392030 RepID=A0A816SWI3_9BILA|nr:unnamed protein product [Rotaria magnacalcarata]
MTNRNKLDSNHSLSLTNSSRSEEEQDAKIYQEESRVFLKGYGIPPPIVQFSESYLSPSLLLELKRRYYLAPTPVQAQAWPILLKGRNLLASAPTGSGKTLAFLIPALIKVMNKQPLRIGEGPIALVLSPSRELALQIFSHAQSFEIATGVHSYCIYGGVPKPPQIRNIQQGGGICIATPGRLHDFLRTQVISLQNCFFLVIDEADRLMELGFQYEIQSIIDHMGFNKQIALFSATWKNEFNFLADHVMRDYIELKIGSQERSISRNICQRIELCDALCKDARLLEILDEIGKNGCTKILIFTNKKTSVEYLTLTLRSLGWYVVGLHSDKSQEDRDSALNSFRLGLIQILITTDVTSRGLDIQNVKHVINYDFPRNTQDYIHRTGRTGRHETSGSAYTLFTYADRRHTRSLIEVLHSTNQYVAPELYGLADQNDAQIRSSKLNMNLSKPWVRKRNRSICFVEN